MGVVDGGSEQETQSQLCSRQLPHTSSPLTSHFRVNWVLFAAGSCES